MLPEYDVVIVGFGLAGASSAACLSRLGFRVLSIDRDEIIRDSFKGELLQPGGVRTLERLGLSHCLEAASVDAIPVEGYVILSPSSGGSQAPPPVRLTYGPRVPATFWEQLWGVRGQPSDDAARAPRGRSFHNRLLVEALRREAVSAGARCVWGECQGLVEEGGRAVGVAWVPRGQTTSSEVRASLVVVCDGMYSQLRGALGRAGGAQPETLSFLTGLLLHHPPEETPLPHPHHGHVILVAPSPVLFYQISPRETRCLVDLPPHHAASPGAMGAYLEGRVCPQLPPCLRAPFLSALARATQDQTLRAVPGKALARGGSPPAIGVVMLGDAASMRHPLTGGGMTVALGDVERLWHACMPWVGAARGGGGWGGNEGGGGRGEDRGSIPHSSSSRDPPPLHSAAAAFHKHRRGFTISVLANALHAVFTTPGEEGGEGRGGPRHALQQACLGYLAAGGACAAGPIGLLAGLSPSPLVLLLHFFAVAYCAGLQGLWTGCGIIIPILWREVWA